MRPQDIVAADDRLQRRARLAAAIGIGRHVGGEQRLQLLHVAATRRCEERVGDLQPVLLGQLKARARGTDMVARAARKLAACCRLPADRAGDLFETEAEYIVEQKGGALERRQPFERQHQRQGDVVDFVVRGLDDRLRQPRPDISLAPVTSGFQVVETEAGHDAAQERFRFAHRIAVGIEPAQKRLLHHILRVRDRSEHPIGDADQSWTQRIESGGSVLVGACRHHAACRRMTGWTPRKPTWSRFQPLIAMITKVRFTCSSAVNSACSAR
jgi:hypothetical protein